MAQDRSTISTAVILTWKSLAASGLFAGWHRRRSRSASGGFVCNGPRSGGAPLRRIVAADPAQSLGTGDLVKSWRRRRPVKQPIEMRQALRGGPVRPVRIERRIIGDDGLGQLGRDHRRTDPRRRSRRNTGGAIGGDRPGLRVQSGQQGFGRLCGLTLRPSPVHRAKAANSPADKASPPDGGSSLCGARGAD
jgi:hypothetical protein